MYVSATTNAVPAATNLTTLGIASNRWSGQWPAARQDERRQERAPHAESHGRTRRTTAHVAHQAHALQTHAKRAVARLKQRFVAGPWIAVDES
jgi:hypothetical protein